MNTYSHNHQSKGAYLHPAAYTAGSFVRNGEAMDNRAYLRYELVLCVSTSSAEDPYDYSPEDFRDAMAARTDKAKSSSPPESGPKSFAPRSSMRPPAPDFSNIIHSARPPASSPAPDLLANEAHQAITAAANIPGPQDHGDELAGLLAEFGGADASDTTATIPPESGPKSSAPRNSMRPVAPDILHLFEKGTDNIAGKINSKVTTAADLFGNLDDDELTDTVKDPLAKTKDILWIATINFKGEITVRGDKGGDAIAQTEQERMADEYKIAGDLYRRFCDREAAKKSLKGDEVSAAIANLDIEQEPSSSKRSQELKRELLKQGLIRVVFEAQKHPALASSELFMGLMAQLMGTHPVEISFADVDQHYIQPVVSAISAEDKTVGDQVERAIPLAFCKALIAVGKGGENELLYNFLQAIAELARQQTEQDPRELVDLSQQILFTPLKEGQDSHSARGTYLQKADWKKLFHCIFGSDIAIPNSPLGGRHLAKTFNTQLKETYLQDLGKIFDTINCTSNIFDIYTLLPVTAAKNMHEKEETWKANIAAKKERLASGDTSVTVSKDNIPLYYLLDAHFQELFRLFLKPSEQEQQLNSNILDLPDDEAVEREKKELEKILMESFKDYAKYEVLSAGGFDDLGNADKLKLAGNFCRNDKDIKVFCEKAGYHPGSQERMQVIRVLENAPEA